MKYQSLLAASINTLEVLGVPYYMPLAIAGTWVRNLDCTILQNCTNLRSVRVPVLGS